MEWKIMLDQVDRVSLNIWENPNRKYLVLGWMIRSKL